MKHNVSPVSCIVFLQTILLVCLLSIPLCAISQDSESPNTSLVSFEERNAYGEVVQHKNRQLSTGETLLRIGGTTYTKTELELAAQGAPSTVEMDETPQEGSDGVIVEFLDPPLSKIHSGASRRTGPGSHASIATEVSNHAAKIKDRQDKVLEVLNKGKRQSDLKEKSGVTRFT